jgi:transmembrane sensor
VLDGWDAAGRAARSAGGRADGMRASEHTRRSMRTLYAAAAAVVLIVLAGSGLHTLGLFDGKAATPVQLASHVGEIRRETLVDGSRVTLDTDTIMTIALATDKRRIVLTRGRARFDVAHDTNRPFIVSANGVAVTAHGTLFDVAIVDHRVAVTLLHGSIDVHQAGPSTKARDIAVSRRLAPGQRLVVTPLAPLDRPQRLEIAETRWVSGTLSFANERLVDAVATANRYNGAQIILADETTRNLRFTGTVRATDLAGFAHLLAISFHLSLSNDAQGTILLAMPGVDAGHMTNKIPG